LHWYKDDAILIAVCIGKMALAERTALFEDIRTRLDAASHPIHLILDWRYADSANLDGVASATIQAITHPNLDQVAVVGLSPALHTWIDTFATVYGVQYLACDNVKDAAEYLESLGRGRLVVST
jgi:hypothetical protein